MGSTHDRTPADVLRAAEAKAHEHFAGWQRARADYENLQKRMEAELSEATRAETDSLLRSLLPVVDYFEAAVSSVPENLKSTPWTEGVLRTHQALHRFLKEIGVASIADHDVPLDPSRHEAIAEEESDLANGRIVRVASLGYLRNGHVLRPAKVTVSAGPALKTHHS